MAMPISNTHLRVPRGFGAILEGLTREILRDQPKDIPQYAAEYFDTLIKQRKERGTDPSEWAAKSEDRYYNNHLFKTLDCTSRTASNINSQDFIAEEEPSPVITHAGSAKGPLDTDTTSSTQADGLSNKINSSAASEQNNSESERHETQLLPATEKIEISDDGDQENTDLEAEPGNVTVSAVDLEKETAASVIEEDAFQKDSFKPSEVRQQSPVSQLEITEQKEEMTSANDTATDVLEESSKHESFVEISFDDVPENDQSENNEQMIKEIMDKTEEILNEQEEQLEKERPGVEYEETVRQSDIKTDDQQTDIKTDDQQTDIKTDDQQTDIKTDDQQTDIKTDDQQTDINTDDQQTDIKTDDQQTDINTDDQQTDINTDDQEDEEINIPNNNKNPSLQDLTEDTSGIVEERREGETEDDPQKSEDAAGDLTQLDENVKILEQQEIQEKNEDDLLEGNEEEQEEGSLEKYFPVSHEDQHSDEEELEEGFSESEIREGHFSPELDHDDPELGQWADREDNNLHQGKRDSPDREKQINEKQEECSRPQEEEDIMDIPLDDPEANRAAAKIQAGFRGHMTRKKMKPEDKTEGEERAEDRGQ